MKIFLALSGGVDSAVAGLLLKRDGHDVVGAFMQSRYCAADDRRDALRVAAALDIPLVTLDVADAYDADVIRPMLEGYASGTTPNPDVDCNALIKFPILWSEAERLGADAIATGHYVRIEINCHSEPFDRSQGKLREESPEILRRFAPQDDNVFHLLCSSDPLKDQTYFLYRLTQEDLSHTLFPVGHLAKTEVRRIAREAGLPVADKRSTRGVCFVGPVRLRQFVGAAVRGEQGSVVATDGRLLGTHEGAATYTVGQRAPVGGAAEPWYVVERRTDTNTLVVSLGDDPGRYQSEATLTDVHWVSGHAPHTTPLAAKIRSRGELLPIHFPLRVRGTEGVTSVIVHFDQPQSALAPGQHIVFYDNELCLGGGVIA